MKNVLPKHRLRFHDTGVSAHAMLSWFVFDNFSNAG